MKIQGFQNTGLALVAATVVGFSTANIFAQETNAFGPYEMNAGVPPETPTTAPTPTTVPMPPATQATPLSSADVQILQLAQAKISDSTIITYIQNSGTVYGLDASQIVYLKQQGVSEGVINAMLNQRSAMAAAQQQQQQQMPPPPDQTAAGQQYSVAQPSTPAPSTVYIVPDSSTSYYNNWSTPYWNYYPGYTWAWGWPVGYWGWGWGWGGRGFYGGYRGFNGGFHGTVTFHGNGGFSGGFHGGGGGSGGGFHGGGGFGGGHR